jgi:hypothetical protein
MLGAALRQPLKALITPQAPRALGIGHQTLAVRDRMPPASPPTSMQAELPPSSNRCKESCR